MIPKFLKELRNPSDIYAAHQPLFFLSFLLGITPFKLVGTHRERQMVVTVYGFINTAIHIVIYTFCYIVTLRKRESIVGYFFRTEVSIIGDTLQLCTGLIALTISFVYCLLRRYKLIELIHSLANIDIHLQDLGVTTDYKSTLRYIFVVLFIKFSIYTTYLCGSFFLLRSVNVYPCITIWIASFLPHLMMSMIVVIFVCTLRQIQHRFLMTNKVLLSVATTTQIDGDFKGTVQRLNRKIDKSARISSVFSEMPKKSVTEIIDSVARIHDQLCDASTLAEQYFTVQMLTIVTISFLIIVFNAYYVLEAAFGKDTSGSHVGTTEFIIFFSYQIGMYFIGIFCVVYATSRVIKQCDITAIYVHKLINAANSECVKEKLFFFSLQLMHRKVKFTACGLFTLDRTLIFTIVGAATTYLVILVQFTLDISDNANGNYNTTTSENSINQ